MVGLIVGEIVVLFGLLGVFLAAHVRGMLRRRNAVSWQLLAMTVVSMLEAVGLVLLGTGHTPPLWMYALVYGAMDAVVVGWLLLLWRARHGVSGGSRASTADRGGGS
jgi:hypothetical protein